MTRSGKRVIKSLMYLGLDRNTANKYRRLLATAKKNNDDYKLNIIEMHIGLIMFYLRFCTKSERRSMFGKLDKTIFAELIVPNKSVRK